MQNRIFYYCTLCHNLVEVINPSGVMPVCCGKEMVKLVPNTTDAATEKHVPSVTRDGKKISVQIGSVAHPMEDAHFIQWILVAQGNRTYRADLKPGQAPSADFDVESATDPISVYEYCNLHGLWVTEA